jgi:hypothetical protein
MNRLNLVLGTMVLACSVAAACQDKKVWTDPNDPSLPVDFKLQGEYAGEKLGAQVIALGAGSLQAVILPGGLPGDGWDGKSRIILAGKVEGDKAAFTPAEGPRKYLAQKPEEFSATRKFPPEGQKPWSGVAEGGALKLKTDEGKEIRLEKIVRKSSTLGAKPSASAIVLFDGKNTDEWKGGRLDAATGFLNTDGNDILSKRKFMNYTLHVEFMLPYRPDARGQGRANSGCYQVDHYEVQILDSFGLDGVNNECGGVYTKAAPKVNMCAPPLVWQTYDVEFTNAIAGPDGKKSKNAVISVRHNGVVIHENQEISGPTGGHRSDPEGTPGPIKLQGHGNPVQFRNVWIAEKP